MDFLNEKVGKEFLERETRQFGLSRSSCFWQLLTADMSKCLNVVSVVETSVQCPRVKTVSRKGYCP
jgi:hypothetical protein